MGWIIPFLASTVASAVVSGATAKRSAQLARNAAAKERDNHFVNLRESARRGGFNPLTALRATGGGGYGQYVPLLSRSPQGEGIAAAGNVASSMIRDQYFSLQNMAHETALNNANNQAAMDRTQAGNVTRSSSNPKYDYDNAGATWPVQWNGQTLNIPTSIAEQLRIPKNGMLMVEHLEAAYGSVVAETLSIMSGEALEKMLGLPPQTLMKTLKQDNGPETPAGDPFTGFEGEPTLSWEEVMQGVHNIINGGWGIGDTVSRRTLGRQHGGKAGM